MARKRRICLHIQSLLKVCTLCSPLAVKTFAVAFSDVRDEVDITIDCAFSSSYMHAPDAIWMVANQKYVRLGYGPTCQGEHSQSLQWHAVYFNREDTQCARELHNDMGIGQNSTSTKNLACWTVYHVLVLVTLLLLQISSILSQYEPYCS